MLVLSLMSLIFIANGAAAAAALAICENGLGPPANPCEVNPELWFWKVVEVPRPAKPPKRLVKLIICSLCASCGCCVNLAWSANLAASLVSRSLPKASCNDGCASCACSCCWANPGALSAAPMRLCSARPSDSANCFCTISSLFLAWFCCSSSKAVLPIPNCPACMACCWARSLSRSVNLRAWSAIVPVSAKNKES